MFSARMNNDESVTTNSHCIREALEELIKLQDFIKNSHIPFFGRLLAKFIGTDTIPIMLQTKKGFLQIDGKVFDEDGNEFSFFTHFFRIDEIDEESNGLIITLLQPIDSHGLSTDKLCDMVKLKKTNIRETIDLSCICGVQPLDVAYLK